MRILIVDDDPLVCTSLSTILQSDNQIEIVGLGYNAIDAVSLYKKLHPDILLMDIRMGDKTGLDAGKIILEKYKDAKILFLTTFSDDDYIIKAIKMGAKGYLIKQNFESIIPALKAVYMGQNVFGDAIINKLPDLINKENKIDFSDKGISEREQDVVSLVAKGLSNKEISEQLYLSEGTIRNYISTILDKLNLRDRTQLAVYYYNNL